MRYQKGEPKEVTIKLLLYRYIRGERVMHRTNSSVNISKRLNSIEHLQFAGKCHECADGSLLIKPAVPLRLYPGEHRWPLLISMNPFDLQR